MVRIQVKYANNRTDDEDGCDNEFIYECESSSRIEDVTRDTVEIANLQTQIQHLSLQLFPCLSPLLHTHPGETTALHRALSEAQCYAAKDQIGHNKPISSYVLRDHLRSIEREFRSYQAMEFSGSKFELLLADLELLQENSARLWWAGKELLKGKRLCDYIGKNEKTKIMLRLKSPISSAAYNSDTAVNTSS